MKRRNIDDIDPDMMVIPDEVDPDMMVDAGIFDLNDKVKTMGRKDKIPAYLFADPDDPTIIYIRTNGLIEILDNSIYQVVIKDLEFEDGEVVPKLTQEFCTALDPCYVDVEEVMTLLKFIKVDRHDILLHIRSASEIVNYWAYKQDGVDKSIDLSKEDLKNDYYPFYSFIKYRAAVECLREFYIGAISNPYKFRDELSDLAREQEMDLSAIKALIDDFEAQADDWLDLVVTITADPKWALRGKYSYALSLEMMKPYHNTYIDKKGGGNGWNRGY